jgi:hypothetical protein
MLILPITIHRVRTKPVAFLFRHSFCSLQQKIDIEEGRKMRETESQPEKRSYWQLIFLQSKVNGAPYNGDELPGQSWDWPKDTYFQRRLHLIKILQPVAGSKIN